ncbi:hypothetical protein [Nocardia mangyaensis]|uniref:hypothetical protein n=1 Tax=Nocardia mangyaensis TaxID=2213200 RepID=UPI002675329B|nr:hypothetical protein [Nocardia mangyaensis]MDO3647588.1 hypothetical protein [Nocardia mangyaensis]
MGYPYGPQQGHDPYAGQGYAQPGYGPIPYGEVPAYGAQPYAAPGYGAPAHAAPGYSAPAYGAPAHGAPPHGYGMPGYGQPQVSGGTAISAAAIALVLSLLGALSTMRTAAVMEHLDGRMANDAELQLLASGGVSAALFFGSILLFCRKPAGRVLVIVASVSGLCFAVIGIIIAMENNSESDLEVNLAPVIVSGVIGGGIALLVLCLAAAKSTDRWIEAGRRPPYPYR